MNHFGFGSFAHKKSDANIIDPLSFTGQIGPIRTAILSSMGMFA